MNPIKLLKSFYVTRDAALKVLEHVDDATWIDFRNVQVVNAEFCDALFRGIHFRYTKNPDAYVGMKNLSFFIHADMQRSAEFLRLQLGLKNFGFLAFDDTQKEMILIGAIQPSVWAGWELTRKRGNLTPGEWRQLQGKQYTLSAYSAYLKDAYNAHILLRRGDATHGGFTYYLPPKPGGV